MGILRINGERWLALAKGLDRELLARPPAPGEWSALECLGHATDTEAGVFTARVRAVLAGQPEVPGYDPDTQGTPITADTDPAEMGKQHAARRAENLALLARVKEADLDRTSRHSELGPFTLGELLNEWAAHDLMHLVQAERAVMQPFIHNTGPWRSNFADHDVLTDAQPA
jgi:hypothetical protein